MGKPASHIWAPQLIGHLADIPGYRDKTPQSKSRLTTLTNLLAESRVRRWLDRFAGDGSANIPPLEAAAALWAGGPYLGWVRAASWIDWLRYQTRETGAPDGLPRLGLFGGSESLSANYQAWLVGAVIAVRLWAIKYDDADLLRLTGRWLTIWAGLTTLLTTLDMPPGEGRNRRGERIHNGVHRSPVSHRSNLAHTDPQDGLMLTLALDAELKMRRPPEWPVEFARALNGNWGIDKLVKTWAIEYLSAPNASSARIVGSQLMPAGINGTISVLWWFRDDSPKYRAVILHERTNMNTPAIMFDAWDFTTNAYHLAYPWPPDRAFGAKGKGTAGWEPGRLWTESPFGKDEFPAPHEEPTLRITIDGNGVAVS